MNDDQFKGKWKQMKGSIKAKYGDLTDDDIKEIDGNREKFIGKVQERYGYNRERVEKDLETM